MAEFAEDKAKSQCAKKHRKNWAAGRLDTSGVPDYNALVEIVRGRGLQSSDVPAGHDMAA